MKLTKMITMLACSLTMVACGSLTEVEQVWCGEKLQTEELNLAADALFKFNKSTSEDLLSEGKSTLDELAEKLTSVYSHVEHIDLVGHTDRLGSENYNYQLGLSRASTVKDYLQAKGVEAPINVTSAGESQPTSLTKDCQGNHSTSELVACLQPDRRVSVNILGSIKHN